MRTTWSARQEMRIRYTEPSSSPPATVSKLDDFPRPMTFNREAARPISSRRLSIDCTECTLSITRFGGWPVLKLVANPVLRRRQSVSICTYKTPSL